jgi:hypothetical protein
MFAASKTDSVSGGPPDDKFNYVTMLLHGDGTNGAQNNTFLDSSTNNFTITRNGNTTQGSFSPYGDNWSNFFDGTGDYLTTPDNSAWDLGSGAFTIESWVFPTASPAQPMIIGQWTSSYSWTMQLSNDGNRYLRALLYDGSFNDYVSSTSLQLNAWNHCAFVRESNTVSLYLNGSRIFTTSYSGTVSTSSSVVSIGADGSGSQPFQGYLSNTRVVVGTALYSGTTYTVPTTPLTAVTNTRLLTCQSNRFIDTSASPKTITVNGNTSVQRFNPFGASTAYSTSVIGGSGYFDGTGDYLQIADSSAFTFGSGDFTVEFWIYSSNTSLTLIIGQNNGNPSPSSFDVRYNGTTITGNIFSSGTTYAVAESMSKNAWHHVALVRNGTSLRIYVDGVSTSSTAVSTVSVNDSSNVLRIGASSETTPDYYFNGYMTDARIVKGTAVYTANFTPPTAPLTAITNTSLLTNFTNGAIFDNAMMSDLETVGNAQISTSVKKYGTGSLAFDGSGDYLTTPNSPNLNFGSGDFTIELWLYSTVGTSNESVVNKGYNNAGNLSYLLFLDSNTLGFFASSNGTSFDIANNVSMGTATQNTWVHFAASRSGSSIRLFRNGTLINTVTSSATIYTGTTNLYIGSSDSGGLNFNGYIDDLRITKGFARYTANFTAPTSALSDTGPY